MSRSSSIILALQRPTHLFELVVSEATWSKLGSDGPRGFEAVCGQSLCRSLAMIPDLSLGRVAQSRRKCAALSRSRARGRQTGWAEGS
jgi:hypothetical protein